MRTSTSSCVIGLVATTFFAPVLFGCGRSGTSHATGIDGVSETKSKAAQPATVEQVATTVDLASETLSHATPYIPPQCYTKTLDERGRAHNPCYVCHQKPTAPNFLDDADLQQGFTFIPAARRNPWTNLFVDRSEAVAAVSDDEILAYARTSNYFDERGKPKLATLAERVPETWDVDHDGAWTGFVPDAYLNFDDAGWDRDLDGNPTGWRAFGYYPFPGTFWPTNGSTGDVMIRLPEAFRRDGQGESRLDVYAVNLAVVEANITRTDVEIDAVDETAFGIDLDDDGRLGTATTVKFIADPASHRFTHYVGEAGAQQDAGKILVRPGLYPVGTEFLHTVRYIDVVDGAPTMAARMKEVRYARKDRWFSAGQIEQKVTDEIKEADDFPDRPKSFGGNAEHGIGNGLGWTLGGFIEDASGELRPQTREEHAYCIGCHGGIGAIEDGIFSFRRKMPSTAPQRGWFHWTQHGLEGVAEPRRADGEGEYAHYLRHNGAGDEFRGNDEVIHEFFTEGGEPDADALARLERSVATLLLPSPARALVLNKAYREIVREQSFVRGRDATVSPANNVHVEVTPDQSTGIDEIVVGPRMHPSQSRVESAVAMAR